MARAITRASRSYSRWSRPIRTIVCTCCILDSRLDSSTVPSAPQVCIALVYTLALAVLYSGLVNVVPSRPRLLSLPRSNSLGPARIVTRPRPLVRLDPLLDACRYKLSFEHRALEREDRDTDWPERAKHERQSNLRGWSRSRRRVGRPRCATVPL
ncbi:hypothetical protein BC628DRAFT_253629 [Trametes gibbosa]|nr:hypothetical protein BC628DRAFT_253629 [Trametes gibbosa]